MSPWTISIAVIVAWLLGRNLFEYAITRVYWDKHWTGRAWVPATLTAVNGIWRFGPMIAFWVYFMKSPGKSRPDLVMFYVGIFSLALIENVFTRHWTRKRWVLSGTAPEDFSFLGQFKYLRWDERAWPWALMVLYLLAFTSNFGGWMFLLIYVPMFYFMYDARRRRKAAPVGAVEMEELPLWTEIRKVCEGFGRKLQQVFVRSRRHSNPHKTVPLFTLDNNYGENKPRLIIPAENFHELNPSTLTAALAWHYAKQPFVRITSHRVINPVTPFLLVLVVVIIVVVTTLIITATVNGPVSTYTFIAIPLLVILSAAAIRIYFYVTRARAHAAAYQVWVDADKRSPRTIQDYVCALAEYNSFHNRIRDPELVIHQLKLDIGLTTFLKRNSDPNNLDSLLMLYQTPEPAVVFAAAAEHVRFWRSI